MTHIPQHQHCPKCIIDDGRLAAAARFFARRMSDSQTRDEALHLADVADAVRAATAWAFERETVTEEQADELHAMSELSCHRAALLRKLARGQELLPAKVHQLLAKWADELADHSTGLLGGEYKGAWTVDGTTGISRKS